MSLLAPTPGQIIDRVQALAVKVAKFEAAGKSHIHLIGEMCQLAPVLPDTTTGPLKVHAKRLYRLHHEMWAMIDTIGKSEDLPLVGATAKTLRSKNLERHYVIAEIDRLLGHYFGDEKL